MEPEAASQALREIQQARSQVAERAHWPLWYHLVLAAMVGLVVAAPGMTSSQWDYIWLAVVAICIALTMWSDKHLGFSVAGWRRGRALWLVIGQIAVIGFGVLAGIFFRTHGAMLWPAFVISPIVACIVFAGSLLWERAIRADIAG
jgi:hypothetical protein